MKSLKYFYLILLFAILVSCSNNQSLELGDGDDVIVRLEILDDSGIDKIEFHANGNIETVNSTDLINYNSISFGFECKREGAFELCVYSQNDSICSALYVENGYKPKITCTKEKIEVKNPIGFGY